MSSKRTIDGTNIIQAITTNSLKVGPMGTTFSAMQFGEQQFGSSGAQQTQVTVTFPAAFNSVPRVFGCVKSSLNNVNDAWACSLKSVTTTTAIFQVFRLDGTSWGQFPFLSWIAFATT